MYASRAVRSVSRDTRSRRCRAACQRYSDCLTRECVPPLDQIGTVTSSRIDLLVSWLEDELALPPGKLRLGIGSNVCVASLSEWDLPTTRSTCGRWPPKAT